MHADPVLPIAVFTGLAGLGFGFFQTPNNQNMLLSAPKERSGAAGGAQGTARLTGLTLGSLLMSLMFGLLPSHSAVHWGLAMAALAASAGRVASLLRNPARARALDRSPNDGGPTLRRKCPDRSASANPAIQLQEPVESKPKVWELRQAVCAWASSSAPST